MKSVVRCVECDKTVDGNISRVADVTCWRCVNKKVGFTDKTSGITVCCICGSKFIDKLERCIYGCGVCLRGFWHQRENSYLNPFKPTPEVHG